ncbi:hypothetical protein Nmel_008555 [Mimus melanotis]
MFQSAQWQWEEEQQRFAVERDNICRAYLTKMEFLIKEKTETEKACQAATVKIKKLEENAEAATLAHMECEYTIKIMQLRIQELEDALNEKQDSRREAVSVVTKKDFKESENAHERGKKV